MSYVAASFSRFYDWMRVDAHDPIGNGVYIQARTGSLPYNNWNPGEPSFIGQCVYMAIGPNTWDDTPCNIDVPFVCEYNII